MRLCTISLFFPFVEIKNKNHVLKKQAGGLETKNVYFLRRCTSNACRTQYISLKEFSNKSFVFVWAFLGILNIPTDNNKLVLVISHDTANTVYTAGSFLVYKFTSASCSSSYIGETCHHFKTRIEEYIKKDSKSPIFKHLHSTTTCFDSFFRVIDKANSKFDLKIKEAWQINWRKPSLEAQQDHFLHFYNSKCHPFLPFFVFVFYSLFSLISDTNYLELLLY